MTTNEKQAPVYATNTESTAPEYYSQQHGLALPSNSDDNLNGERKKSKVCRAGKRCHQRQMLHGYPPPPRYHLKHDPYGYHHHVPYMKTGDVYHQPFASASSRGGVFRRVVFFLLLAIAGFALFGLGRYYEYHQGSLFGSCSIGQAHGARGAHLPHHQNHPHHSNGLNHPESTQEEHFEKGHHEGGPDKNEHESTARPNHVSNNPPKLNISSK